MTTVADALSAINHAMQGESRDQREDRIWEQWCETECFARTTDEDAIWFLANGRDWADAFMACIGWDQWPRDIPDISPFESLHMTRRECEQLNAYLECPEPMPTSDTIAWLEGELATAKQRVTDDPSKDSLKDERNLHIAVEGLKARYARTGDDNTGW